MAAIFAGMKNYEAAARAKFGDAGKVGDDDKMDLVADVEKSKFPVQGDTATAVKKDKTDDKNPMKLVKKGGEWKVDLSSLPADMKPVAAAGTKVKKAFDDTAGEISAGKYKTADEAKAASQQRMAAAMGPG